MIILFGIVGDKIQKYIQHVAPEASVSLIHSKECDASEKILITVKEASAKWMSLRSDRIVIWIIPHYVERNLGEFDVGDSLEISLDSSQRFANYIPRLKLQWVAESPKVPFGLLNRALFAGKRSKDFYNSFSAVSVADYKFPINLLTDGLHPTAQLAKDILKFLHKSVLEVHDKLTGKKIISAPSSSTTASSKIGVQSKKHSYKFQPSKRNKFLHKKPYVPK